MNNRAFTRASGHRLAPDLTEQQKHDIAEAFRVLDMDNSNIITPDDLKVALRALGYEPDKQMIRRVVAQMDRGGVSNNLVYEEFESIMRDKFFDTSNEQQLRLAFQLIANDENAQYITFNNLRRVCDEIGVTMSDEQLREIVQTSDILDHDNRISRTQFMQILSQSKEQK